MVVGPSGKNADRVTTAFEIARVRVVRVGSAPVACEKLGSAMPQVVLLVSPPAPDQRDDLIDRAAAVGAVVVDVDESLEGEAYDEAINEIITTAITRKMMRDAAQAKDLAVGATAPPPFDDEAVDDGWDD